MNIKLCKKVSIFNQIFDILKKKMETTIKENK